MGAAKINPQYGCPHYAAAMMTNLGILISDAQDNQDLIWAGVRNNLDGLPDDAYIHLANFEAEGKHWCIMAEKTKGEVSLFFADKSLLNGYGSIAKSDMHSLKCDIPTYSIIEAVLTAYKFKYS